MLVGDIEEPVVAAATRTPFEARRRVFVIERAETMNDQVANKMLKTLEEPPAFAHLVLLTSRPGDMLPTIASRCQHVRFDAPAPGEIAARLEREGVAPDAARACARLALGDAERALALALGDGPALRAGAEGLARAALRGELAERPWLPILAQAKKHGDAALADVEERVAAELEFLPKRDRRRAEREGLEAGRRSQRRARTRRDRLRARALRAVVPRRRLRRRRRRGARARHRPRSTRCARTPPAARPPTACATPSPWSTRRARRSILNPTEELALEALASRLGAAARLTRGRRYSITPAEASTMTSPAMHEAVGDEDADRVRSEVAQQEGDRRVAGHEGQRRGDHRGADRRPVAVAEVAHLEEPREHDRRHRQQERVARRVRAREVQEQAGGDRRARARDAGHERQRLRAADEEAVARGQRVDLAVAPAHALGVEHHEAEDDQRRRDEVQRAELVLDRVGEDRARRPRSGSCPGR